MSEKKKYWRVEKWFVREDDDGNEVLQFHRERNFHDYDEAKEYFDNASSMYHLKFYEVEDVLMHVRDPYEEPWDDAAKARLRESLSEMFGESFTDDEWKAFLEKVESMTDGPYEEETRVPEGKLPT